MKKSIQEIQIFMSKFHCYLQQKNFSNGGWKGDQDTLFSIEFGKNIFVIFGIALVS